MGVLTGMLQPIENRATPYADLFMWDTWGKSAAGVTVTEESALRYSAVYACVRILSESIAGLPLILYRQTGRNRERADRHPLYFLLKEQPNPDMTSFELRELLVSHVATWGNAYAQIEWAENGKPLALWPLRPDRMEKIERQDGELVYWYRRADNQLQPYPGGAIMHWRGLGSNGLVGWSPIRLHMESIGLGLATEEYGSRFFSNGARPGVVLKHPGKLSPEALGRLKTSWASDHQGLENAHRTKVLEEGMDLTTIGIPPEEAQFLETRKFQVTEIARIFRVPPHMLADLERATFSNIEHQSIDFVVHTLRPWMVRIEQAIQRDLLTPNERGKYFVKHLADGLLRGDTLTRYQAYSIGIQNSILTPNEVREKEDLNPVDGADDLLVPLNMMPAGQQPPAPVEDAPQEERDVSGIETRDDKPVVELRVSRQQAITRYVRLFEEAAGRLVKRETADIRRAVPKYMGKRSVGDFEKWLATFYEDLRGVLPDYFRALMLTLADEILAAVARELGEDAPAIDEKWITEYLNNLAQVYTVGGEKQLRAILAEVEDEEAAAEAILERMDGWDENRAIKTGRDQAFEAGNALAKFGYAALGVRYLVWSGGDCPLCQSLNGRRVGIDSYFLKEGDSLNAGDGVAPFPAVRNIGHPPLHGGCDCVIVAG